MLPKQAQRQAFKLRDAKGQGDLHPEKVSKFQDVFLELYRSGEFLSLPTFRDQVAWILERYPKLTLRQIAIFMDVHIESIRYQLQVLTSSRIPGRPRSIPAEVERKLFLYIEENAICHPVTISDIQNYLQNVHNIDIGANTLRKYLKRSGLFQLKKVEAIEAERLRVTADSLNSYFNRLRLALDGLPADMVFNLDESGFDMFADARKKWVVLPKGSDVCYYGVERNEKRVTLLGCISAAGSSLRPLAVLSRQTIDIELFELGFTPDLVDYEYSSAGYMTSDIFAKWLMYTFVPHINRRRAAHGDFSLRAKIIMDNCSAHSSAMIEEIFAENGIDAIPLVPHSSNTTQMLDLGIFGNCKLNQERIHPKSNHSTQTKQLVRLFAAWQATTHPYAITQSFRDAGVNVYWDDHARRLMVRVDANGRKIPDAVRKDTRLGFSKSRITVQGLWDAHAPDYTPMYQIANDDEEEETVDQVVKENREVSELCKEFWAHVDQMIEQESSSDSDFCPNESVPMATRRGQTTRTRENVPACEGPCPASQNQAPMNFPQFQWKPLSQWAYGFYSCYPGRIA